METHHDVSEVELCITRTFQVAHVAAFAAGNGYTEELAKDHTVKPPMVQVCGTLLSLDVKEIRNGPPALGCYGGHMG